VYDVITHHVIFSPLTKLLFKSVDDDVLTWLYDDNMKVEPLWYCPIIPMILVNGCEGIGTGWSTRIPNHDIREIVENCRRFIRGEDFLPMVASYKNFRGNIEAVAESKFIISGEISLLGPDSLEITELPIKCWTQQYKENVLEPMVQGTEKVPQSIIGYKEYYTDTTVRFVVQMKPDKLREAQSKGLHKFFNLQNSLCCNNTLVLFDEYGSLKKYEKIIDILEDFCRIRLNVYVKRKEFLIGMLTAEAKRLQNQARFIHEKVEKIISIEKMKKKNLMKLLVDCKYDSDPVKSWQASVRKNVVIDDDVTTSDEDNDDEVDDVTAVDFNYILGMPLWSLTQERMDHLIKEKEAKEKELDDLMKKTPRDIWNDDLDAFIKELEVVEARERNEQSQILVSSSGKSKSGKKSRKSGKLTSSKVREDQEIYPSKFGERIEPKADCVLIARMTAETKPRVSREKKNEKVKKEKVKKEKVIKKEVSSDESDTPPSLMSRINKKNKQATMTSFVKKPMKLENDDSDDDVKVDFEKALKKEKSAPKRKAMTSSSKTKIKQEKISPKPTKRKKVVMTSSEESDFVAEDDFSPDVPTRRTRPGKPKKYVIDDSDESDF